MDGDLLVTLRLDPQALERFEALRRRHFPSARNQVPAHVMLLHALPPDGAVLPAIAAVAQREPLAVTVAGLRSLGRGVAYVLHSPALEAVHSCLARRFEPWLTAQDRQAYSPHVTVQNKVTSAVARATLDELRAEFAPWACTGVGLEVWTYRGGPWEPLAYEAFSGTATS